MLYMVHTLKKGHIFWMNKTINNLNQFVIIVIPDHFNQYNCEILPMKYNKKNITIHFVPYCHQFFITLNNEFVNNSWGPKYSARRLIGSLWAKSN